MSVPKDHEIDARLVDARLAMMVIEGGVALDQTAAHEILRACYLRGYGDGLEQALTDTTETGSILGAVKPQEDTT